MLIYDNKYQTKENQNQPEVKFDLQDVCQQ